MTTEERTPRSDQPDQTPDEHRDRHPGAEHVEATIENLLREERIFPPPLAFKDQALLQDASIYDRTAKRYPRYAVAELKGDLCVGCNVKLRPMVAAAVRKGEQIVQCENCTRLLYAVKPPPPAPPSS